MVAEIARILSQNKAKTGTSPFSLIDVWNTLLYNITVLQAACQDIELGLAQAPTLTTSPPR